MADNVAITAGSGTTIATDDIGGVQYQRVKLAIGADGSAADLAFGGAAAASSLPVVAASADVTLLNAVASNLSPTTTAAPGAGAACMMDVSAYTTVVLQAIWTAMNMTVSFEASNNGTDWSPIFGACLRLPTAAGSCFISGFANSYLTGDMFAIRTGGVKYLRAKTTGYVSGTLTVIAHGTMGETAGITSFIMPTGAGALSVTSQSQTATDGRTNAATAEMNQSNGAAAILSVGPSVYNGSTWDRQRTPSTFKSMSAVAIGTIATVWTPASGKKIRLMGGTISVDAACNVLFEDNTAGNFIFRTPKLLVDTPYTLPSNIVNGLLSAAANNVLKATASASANITGTLFGTEE
jgi:hypothetical protein